MGICLYTPGTGFPDLEVKIAYGLARLGIEAGVQFRLVKDSGVFRVVYEDNNFEKINESFYLLIERILTNQKFYDLGVKARYKTQYTPIDQNGNFITRFKKYKLENYFSSIFTQPYDFNKNRMCKHDSAIKFGGSKSKTKGGLILLASIHAGKPQIRDNKKKDINLGLCEICGYLSVLGKESFGFTIQLGRGKNRKFVLVLPIPRKQLNQDELIELLALQKSLYGFWLSDLIPLRIFPLGLFAKLPSISEIVENLKINFHLTLVSKDNRGDTIIEQTQIMDTLPFSKFINYSPYNSALVEKLLRGQPKISSLLKLTGILIYHQKQNIADFARLFNQETKTELYNQSTQYLLKEVAMIPTEIIENPAIHSLARTLRYFVRKRKYGYADDIRNSRKESREFEYTIAKMLREAELRRVQQEQEKNSEHWIHLPKDQEMREVFKLANKDFESTKTALVILAFTFPQKQED